MNRERAPSGPVKVVVTNRPHSRRHNGIELSGVSALLAWFPASWASKIAPCFIGEEGGSIQLLQEVAIVCPHREFEGLQRDAVDQVLQAVKFTDKNAPGLNLALDDDFQTSNCFTELIRGYMMGAVEPYTMMGLQPTGATRVTLEVIIPSPTGLTPEKWKQTATLCPLDWPSNYSLLRLWHTTKSFPVCCTTQAAIFFSSSVADVALWLGPYMSISGKTSLCTRTKRSGNAGKSQQPQNHTTQPDDPQIPQPDLRFVKRNHKPDKRKGPEPKQKQPPKRFAKRHSGLTTASFSKTCENEL